MEAIQVVKYVQLGERKQRCWLCLLTGAGDGDASVYAVAIRLHNFIGRGRIPTS